MAAQDNAAERADQLFASRDGKNDCDGDDVCRGMESVRVPLIGLSPAQRTELNHTFHQYITDSVLSDGTAISHCQPPAVGSNDSGDSDDCDGEWTCDCAVDSNGDWLCTAGDGEHCDCVGSFGKSIPSSHLQAANPRNLTGNFYTAPSAASSSTQPLQIEAIHENLTVVECSPYCPCASRCANRVSQRGPRAKFVVEPTSTGLGLFHDADTTLALARGAFVCLYAGEYLTTAEARARWAKALEDNYTLSLKMSHSSRPTSPEVHGAEAWDGTIHIDPRRMGNIGRFLNHSCEPNCVIYLVKWGAGNTWPRAAIFANRDIAPGEQLTFDYGNASGIAQASSGLDTIDPAESSIKRTRCLCGSTRCRGYMPFDETL